MKVRLRKVMIATAIVSPLLALGAPQFASADVGPVSDAVVAVGTGNIAPGLDTTPRLQTSVTFSGTIVIAGDETGPGAVSFAGHSFGLEDVTVGAGTGTLSGAVSGTVNYARNGNIVTLSGGGLVGGEAHGILAAVCEFVPTSAPTVVSYALACQGALTS